MHQRVTVMIKRPGDEVPKVRYVTESFIRSFADHAQASFIYNEVTMIQQEDARCHVWRDGSLVQICTIPLRGTVMFVGFSDGAYCSLSKKDMRLLMLAFFKQEGAFYA